MPTHRRAAMGLCQCPEGRKLSRLADRASVIENGRISLAGTGEALLSDAHMRRAYLGLR